jgi:hypothetical protein
VSLRSADPRSGRIGGGGEGRAPGGRQRVDVAGNWSAGEGELQNERKGENSFRLNMEVIRTYHIVYGCPPEWRQV